MWTSTIELYFLKKKKKTHKTVAQDQKYGVLLVSWPQILYSSICKHFSRGFLCLTYGISCVTTLLHHFKFDIINILSRVGKVDSIVL